VGPTQKLLRFGVFELNLDTLEVRKSGAAVKLPPQPFKLLVLLASHAGQIVTREEIEAQLWGDETHVDFEHGVNKCIKQIRNVLGDNADQPIYIETLPRQGYRFLAPVVSKTIAAPGPRVVESQSGERGRPPAVTGGLAGLPATVGGATAPAIAVPQADTVSSPQVKASSYIPDRRFHLPRRRMLWIGSALLVLACAAGGVFYWRAHRPALTDKDTIVLADFDNKTGDAVFDDTLKQALAMQLEQSPFLTLIPENRVSRTLKLMDRPADDRLTPEVTREVCQRTGSAVMVMGSIAPLTGGYVIGLKATECSSGEVLADTLTEAKDRDHVLKALGTAAQDLRSKLGESLASVQKDSTPLEEATTPSLEALKAYSLGQKTLFARGETAALPLYQRAVELDPGFARAYAVMAGCYSDLNEAGRAAENARKAYDLRSTVSERERFYIEETYYIFATGELDKAEAVTELWKQTYPRDGRPYMSLGYISSSLGNWEKALQNAQEALRLDPSYGVIYYNVGNDYMALNRLEDSEAVFKQAEQHQMQAEDLLFERYQLAFLQGDTARMAQLSAAARGKPGAEDQLLILQANTAAWHGKLKDARALTLQAMQSAQRNDGRETAATYQAAAALYELKLGNADRARADVKAALKLAPNRDVRVIAALTLAQTGDIAAAEKLTAQLAANYPQDTLVQKYWLPTIRAGIALQRKDPNRAIELLQTTAPLELGTPTAVNVYLCPIYLRGEAYLMLHDGNAAAAEFRKFVDHYGIVVNFPWGALARLALARAYALDAQNHSAARDQARAACKDFLALWKDADPDISIYRQAQAEYAKLQ